MQAKFFWNMSGQEQQSHKFQLEQLVNNPEYRKKLTTGILVVLVAVTGFFLYRNYVMIPNEKEGFERMYKAEFYFAQDSLQLALDGRPGEFDGFLTIADEFGGKPGSLAHLYAGLCYLNLGNFQEAIPHFEAFDGNDMILAPSAIGNIGDCYLELGNAEEAVVYYEKAAGMNANMLTSPRFLNKAAMVQYELLNNKERALKLYEKLAKEYYFTAEGRNAERMVALIEQELAQ